MKIALASPAILAAGASILISAPAAAGPITPLTVLSLDQHSTSQNIQYRRGYSNRGYYERRRRDNGLEIGLGIAGAIIGGAIIAESVRRNSAEQSGYTRCSRAFRSFDPDTGTYTSYDGETLRCPYL